MLILPQTVLMKWNPANKKWYESKGYIFTKYNDEFKINVEDLSKNSHMVVKVLCDYCLENNKETILNMAYQTYNRNLNGNINKIACIECRYKKIKESNLITYGFESTNSLNSVKETKRINILKNYGVDHISKIEEVKEKKIQTSLKNYGVEFYLQTDKCKEEAKIISLQRYNCEHFSQAEEIKDKTKQTNLKNYGVEYPMQNKEFQENTFNTNLNRYGSKCPLQNKDIQEKIRQSLYKNGTCKTSSEQLEIYNILKNLNYTVELNYPVSRCSLDVAIFINDNIKIDIEYDGWYWHQDKLKDRRRDEYLKTQGWKIFRIKGANKIPSLKQIQEGIFKLVNTDRTFTQIVLDDWKEKEIM